VPTQFPEHEAVEVYGNKAEYAAWKRRDPIYKFRGRLTGNGALAETAAKQIEDRAATEMEDAVQFALASPLPAGEEAVKYVYA